MAFKFLKTGAASAQMAKQEEAAVQQRKENSGKLFRFFLADKEECRITFIDGDLNEEGFLIPPRWYEHNLLLNGKWFNYFVCPEKTNPDAHDSCPIDESGDYPTLVAGMTIIDHRSFPSKDGKKMYKDTRKLMIVKPQTMELLAKHAAKRGGLAGCTFDVSRVGDNAAAVGSMFDFVEKKPIAELEQLYMEEVTDPKTNKPVGKVTYFKSADFEKEIVYRTGDELRKLGLGKPIQSNMNPGGETITQAKATDYASHL